MFVVYCVALSTPDTVSHCLINTYIWPTCNDNLLYKDQYHSKRYIAYSVYRWNSTCHEIQDQFVIVGTYAGLVCCPKTHIEWSTRILVLSGIHYCEVSLGTALAVLHILTICHVNTWSEALIQQTLFIVILWFAPASRCDNFSQADNRFAFRFHVDGNYMW